VGGRKWSQNIGVSRNQTHPFADREFFDQSEHERQAVLIFVTVHGSKTLKMQAIFDATEREYRLIWAWPAEKPRFRDDFATFARERLLIFVSVRPTASSNWRAGSS